MPCFLVQVIWAAHIGSIKIRIFILRLNFIRYPVYAAVLADTQEKGLRKHAAVFQYERHDGIPVNRKVYINMSLLPIIKKNIIAKSKYECYSVTVQKYMRVIDLRRLKIAFTLLIATFIFGIIGYHVVEDMSFFDAFYMTIITISTVGFQEVKVLSPAGRIITVIIISTGITIGAYSISTLLRMLIEGELRKTLGRRKVEKQIAKLKSHFIICGYGRIGKIICRELKENRIDFVIIDNMPELTESLEDEGALYLPMDATSDETLVLAGIERASGIVPALGSDAENIFITLTARGINPDIFILARASEEKNEIKLKRAGASRVVSPYLIGGKRMAQVIIRPTVVDFIDIAVMEGSLGLLMEETTIKPDSDLIGKNLIESNLRKDYGVIIVLIKKWNGKMIFNPQPNEILESRDVLVVLGKKDDMKRMNGVM